MKTTLILLLLCCHVWAVDTTPPHEAQIIHANAAAKWPGNYDMQKYETDLQTTAFNKLKHYQANGMPKIPPSDFQSILKAAAHKWDANYDMQVYEIEKQAKAYLALKH